MLQSHHDDPRYRFFYESKIAVPLDNGDCPYALDDFIHAVRELLRRDVRLLDYKSGRLERLLALFLEELQFQLEGKGPALAIKVDEGMLRNLINLTLEVGEERRREKRTSCHHVVSSCRVTEMQPSLV